MSRPQISFAHAPSFSSACDTLPLLFQLALQDHNYCAAPPPSPPRSPTPPPSPYSHSLSMGVQPSPSHQEPPPVNNNDDQSFTFGIAGYKAGGPSSSLGAYPSPHSSGGAPAPMQPSPLSRLKQTIQEAGVGPMTPLGEEVRLIWKHIISIKNKTMVSGRS